ncbi:uncharacterized protein LOC136083403 [Hydra vulgaris]|uniref:Uncharacterized protein LOC136083403 n=1 Tax=Hydra vulgaris TaxID=6087 RepID=A0ABM4CB16_HYDVU
MGLRGITIETKWQVVGLNKSGLSNQEIGRQLEISECSVRTTLKNYNEFGTVKDKSGSGRPKKMSEWDENEAIMLSRRNPNISIAEIASDLNTALGAHQKKVWRYKNEKYNPRFFMSRVQRGGGSISIWGCIAGSGNGLAHLNTDRLK